MDCSKLDLDAPLRELKINASRTSFEAYVAGGQGKTLREMPEEPTGGGLISSARGEHRRGHGGRDGGDRR